MYNINMTYEWDNTTTVMTLDELKKLPPLTEEEKRVLHNAKPSPTDDCPAVTAGELKEFRPWNTKQKKPVTINLDSGAVEYFKSLAEETGVSYQNLINMYLVQCAREKKRPVFA